jgi:hypothetical protein
MQGKKLILLLTAAIGIWSCSTEVDLNAPYDSKTVVFGLLDPGLDTQWVKINRTWLGEGNNALVAAIRDSSEYASGAFVGVVQEIQNGTVISTYALHDTLLDNKETDGIFFAPEHKAYYFATPAGLNSNSEYRVSLDFPNKVDVEATTNIIATVVGNIIYPPIGNDNFKLNWATVSPNGTTYANQNIKWSSTANAKRYEAKLRIWVKEKEYADNAQTQLLEERIISLDWSLGTESPSTTNGGETILLPVNGESFYRFMASRFDANPRIRRELGIWDPVVQIARSFDLILVVANEELDTYLDINEPVTGIIQERPEYTNISNGLGLFASRSSQVAPGYGYTDGTMKELAIGQFTSTLGFCSPNPFNEFYCGE